MENQPIHIHDKKAVLDLQLYLMYFGYLNTIEFKHGEFDEPTKIALANFQKARGLTSTGDLDDPTANQITAPCCGGPQDDDKATANPPKWKKKKLTYSYGHLPAVFGPKDIIEAVEEALYIWSQVTTLEFRRTHYPMDHIEIDLMEMKIPLYSDIVFGVHKGAHGNSDPFNGPGNVVAHASYPPYNGMGSPLVISSHVHFDHTERWHMLSTPAPAGYVSFRATALHEIGHVLGLSHSATPSSIMYPYVQPAPILHPEDIARIQALYGAP